MVSSDSFFFMEACFFVAVTAYRGLNCVLMICVYSAKGGGGSLLHAEERTISHALALSTIVGIGNKSVGIVKKIRWSYKGVTLCPLSLVIHHPIIVLNPSIHCQYHIPGRVDADTRLCAA